MKYYLIAGEPSGDAYGRQLMRSIRHQDGNAIFRFWGGDQMMKEEGTLVRHIKDTSFMGLLEVVKNLSKVFANFKLAKKDILDFKPDVVVFIDYPGFNLRMAKWSKKQGFKTAYYIAPKVWAWNERRTHTLKKYIDLLLVILPFEEEYFKNKGLPCTYVGHPLLAEIDYSSNSRWKDQLTLVPGSRKQEIKKMLPIFLEASKLIQPGGTIVIPCVSHLSDEFYLNLIKDFDVKVELVREGMGKALKGAQLALVTSGTATLETALYKVPQIVCYKTAGLTYFLAKSVLSIPFISLPNLILNKAVVPELIQSMANASKIEEVGIKILKEKDSILDDYNRIATLLYRKQKASDGAADEIIHLAKLNNN